MTDDPPDKRTKRKTRPMGSSDRALANTLPSRAKSRERADTAPQSSAVRVESSPDAFPPAVWARQDHLVTSTRTGAAPRLERGSGQISLSGNRVGEDEARQILSKRFAEAGLTIQADYPFRSADMMVVLDGFDPAVGVGYQYVSHADADVVTDHDTAADLALRQLAADGHARVLVIHDVDAPSGAELLALADEFLTGLDLTHPG